MIFPLTLTSKKQLTHDVFYLTFSSSESLKPAFYGQFITFLLKAGGRAYSIANTSWNSYEFIIKRLENWKGGSKEVCDILVGDTLRAVWPAGHFVLREQKDKKRLFLWTGTGFAPLYFQILGTYKLSLWWENRLVFWVREKKDVFMIEELNKIQQEKGSFSYNIYISREQTPEYNMGRITEFITLENIAWYEEFYLCGSHAMVVEAHKKLVELWVSEEQIFSEKY